MDSAQLLTRRVKPERIHLLFFCNTEDGRNATEKAFCENKNIRIQQTPKPLEYMFYLQLEPTITFGQPFWLFPQCTPAYFTLRKFKLPLPALLVKT
ncbi:Protein of unknown function [Gryllus bimaculatus]|nr:Protein of unknown function [Gryllus bimaculatus]